jgi:hypothetical protein
MLINNKINYIIFRGVIQVPHSLFTNTMNNMKVIVAPELLATVLASV